MDRVDGRVGVRPRLAQGHADHRVDFRVGHRKVFLQPGIKRIQRELGGKGGVRRPGNRQPVAPGRQRDPELTLDACQMLIVLAEQHRQQAVVVELQHGGRARLGGGEVAHATPSAPTQTRSSGAPRARGADSASAAGASIRPERLLGWALST